MLSEWNERSVAAIGSSNRPWQGIDKSARKRGPTPLTLARVAPWLHDNTHCNSGLSRPQHRIAAFRDEKR